MKTYQIPMVPGPVSVPDEVLEMYGIDYGSGDLEPEYLELYNLAEANLRRILGTRNQVVIQSGEGMVVLWSALKSCLKPGDRVLAIGTGVFGYGIGEMAESVGAQVRTVGLEYNQTLGDLTEVEKAVEQFRPKMITAVHCETPSGTLNPLTGLGALKKESGVDLFYVDAVASIGGVPVMTDECHIDLCLGGAQKCLSAPPGMSFLSVSERAWEIVEEVGYAGYDALMPFREAQKKAFFPYTPYWHGTAGLNRAAELILEEGLEQSFARHEEAATYCRDRIKGMGLTLFPEEDAIDSPTVTAVNLPDGFTWEQLDKKLRERRMVAAGSLGPLDGKIFRIGHMGSQARMDLVKKAMDVLEEAIR